MPPIDLPPDVEALLDRSHRLGADRCNTNYAGGNASAKSMITDPALSRDVEVMWVKGSGGDLGTLRPEGLAVLDVERLRGLRGVYQGVEHEDEMVDLFGHCSFGHGGATPSIDTAMHGLVTASHVDHLHPDSVIALAASADGEELTRRCFGDEVAWVPWRRPGFELGLQVERLQREHPDLRGVVLGGHGLTTWAATSAECEANSLHVIQRAAAFIEQEGSPTPFGAERAGFAPLPAAERRRRAAELAPLLRGLASTDHRMIGHFVDDPAVLELLASEACERLVVLGTSCPDHFLRTKVRPMLLDLSTSASLDEQIDRLKELHAAYRAEYSAYYERHAEPDSPPMRGADPAIVLVPGVGMFSFGADAQTARVAGEFYLNAIAVMRGAEALSRYEPIPESEKFRIEYWELEERKLRLRPSPPPLHGRVAVVTGGASGIGRATAGRLAADGACVVVADVDGGAADAAAKELGGPDRAIGVTVDVGDPEIIGAMFAEAALAYGGVDIVVNNAGLSISKSLAETGLDEWDVQHRVMSRGSFLVSQSAARVLIAQNLGGDIVYIVSKNAVVAGPNNVAYGSAKAAQAHQVRLLAVELGEHGIRVNGVNPDGVVRGSGIFAGEWGVNRAEVYGVEREELGAFYASRTLLKDEILPEHVADAVAALVRGELAHTTGLLVPVDGGVPAAFLR